MNRLWSGVDRYIINDRSGKSVLKAVLTFVIISVAIGCLTGTGFNIGEPWAGASEGGGLGSTYGFGQVNVLQFGTTNFLPIPYFGGGDGGGGVSGPSTGQTSTGIPTVPYDPVTKEVLVDYTNPVTGETLTKGTILPTSMLNETKLFEKAILSDPALPQLNTPTTTDGWYNQSPPAAKTGGVTNTTTTQTGTSSNK